MSSESIVILGGSFAGISAAHYALKHVLPQLPKKEGITYNVTLVNPSKEFFWRIGAPRAAVSKKLMPDSKMFFPIESHFSSYPKGSFTFVQGTATAVDPATRTVTITTPSEAQTSLTYVALIIATGFSTPSPLFTQSTNATDLKATYDSFQKTFPSAKTVVIGGAGPVGVETAGEIAEALNGKPGFLAPAAPKNPKAKVTLICAEKKMLPILRESISKQAETLLKKLGAEVLYNIKVVSTSASGEGAKTTVTLSDGKTIEADIYIDCTGIRPNTSFLPGAWIDNRNRVACNPKTLRVEAAGPRVYVVGDVGSYTRGGCVDLADAIPVALTNLRTDLVAHITGEAPGGDRVYKANLAESQICPIGTGKGVGAFNGNKLPSIMVWAIKGRDYMSGQLVPQFLSGSNYSKEGKWVPEPVAAVQTNVGLSSG
ncbi:hypothetical protein BCR34DRAFT_553345 [Clohesyomyces aquaticus]|uniref:FAD/NAD(P)-binding domain-containing protein n=1 Tax=Clohesyomyces aquaticus TaxID=1231657 RepID=A0A1Y2A889_9PLEO|nr:hypothetical protein BCR34DRAFT_553345 [Clohesyomyces aquaticus]